MGGDVDVAMMKVDEDATTDGLSTVAVLDEEEFQDALEVAEDVADALANATEEEKAELIEMLNESNASALINGSNGNGSLAEAKEAFSKFRNWIMGSNKGKATVLAASTVVAYSCMKPAA